ncbi:MAG: PepSY-associated helix protein [Acidobacteriaceae bacterium]|nr:PepSY-associated helix protein [Acidobacteriaceae bacterium]
MTARRMLFWLHLLVGIVVGSVLVFLATTGCILAFQHQIIDWSERGIGSNTSVSAPCLQPSQILAQAAVAQHGTPISWVSYADRRRPTEIEFPKGQLLLVDSCSGRVLSANAGRLRGFFDEVHDLHRYVAWAGVRHEGLRSVKNAGVLAFLFLLVSGSILWLPRQWTSKHVRTAVVPRWRGLGRASEWSLHTVVGFWLFLPLACIVLTGLIMAYAWANALLYRAAGEPPPSVRAEREPKSTEPLAIEHYKDLDPLIARASTQDPAWASLLLRIPPAKGKEITINLDEGDGGDPRKKSQLTLVRKSAEVTKWMRYGDNTRARKWRLLAHFIHTGELFGIVGQTLAFVTTLGSLLLVVTGFSLSIRRYLAWRLRRKRALLHAHDVVTVQ